METVVGRKPRRRDTCVSVEYNLVTAKIIRIHADMSTTKTSSRKTSAYHHGDLRAALLRAAEQILERDGPNAISLRACAKEAGVSHAGPSHHFPNLAALLSALAAVGFERLASALREASSRPGALPTDSTLAYVGFAQNNRQMFYLMNDPSRLDSAYPELEAARQQARMALMSVGGVSGERASVDQVGAIAARWALAHGFALLMLTERLGGLTQLVAGGATDMDLFEAALRRLNRA